jgi:hypothetical protein
MRNAGSLEPIKFLMPASYAFTKQIFSVQFRLALAVRLGLVAVRLPDFSSRYLDTAGP